MPELRSQDTFSPRSLQFGDQRDHSTAGGSALAAANRDIPIIFVTGHGDIPMSVQAMKGGAIEFLTKPFRDQDLLDAIQLGLSRDRAPRENDRDLAALRERFASLRFHPMRWSTFRSSITLGPIAAERACRSAHASHSGSVLAADRANTLAASTSEAFSARRS